MEKSLIRQLSAHESKMDQVSPTTTTKAITSVTGVIFIIEQEKSNYDYE